MRIILLISLIVPLISARGTPLTEIINIPGLRISNNVIEDANLDVPDLVKKYKYPLEVHNVTTSDGYVLEMHRIPHGRTKSNVTDEKKKPVVFLMHGLLCSSADFVIMGPESGLAYILADEGYDVWLGNARGNYYSRRHTSLNPDELFGRNFWKFSWDEIGNIDVPAMIDYILALKRQSKLHYIGHSQGTTSFFVMGSLRPEYNSKIISMNALAPVAYMANNRNRLLRFIAPFSTSLERLAQWLGVGEFLPHSEIRTLAGEVFCRNEVIFQPICRNIIFLVGGWNEPQLNTTVIPIIFGHTPAGASVRQLAHYGQSITNKGFKRYDYGWWLANIQKYGSLWPPSYDLSKVTSPVFLHYSNSDPLAHVDDVDTLWQQLGNGVGKFCIADKKFSHLDFLWGIDAQKFVYNKVIDIIKSMDGSEDL